MVLEGRVAQVLNARELAINIGRRTGVETGTRFAVLAATPLEIKDPETGEVLETLDQEKVRVEVTEVYDRISICRTYQVRHIPGKRGLLDAFYAGSALSQLQSVAARDIPVTLRTDDSSLPPPLSPEESYVKPNDRVREVGTITTEEEII